MEPVINPIEIEVKNALMYAIFASSKIRGLTYGHAERLIGVGGRLTLAPTVGLLPEMLVSVGESVELGPSS